MAWTAPMTAVANSTFTAAQFNLNVRDNLNETAPAKATSSGSYFAGAGVNAIAERRAVGDANVASGTTTSASYGDLSGTTAGPSVTVSTGTAALIIVHSSVDNSGTTSSRMGYDISGATSVLAADLRALHVFGVAGMNISASDVSLWTSLTPGSNTFTAKYRAGGGTATFSNRRIIVMPF